MPAKKPTVAKFKLSTKSTDGLRLVTDGEGSDAFVFALQMLPLIDMRKSPEDAAQRRLVETAKAYIEAASVVHAASKAG